jgi:acyl-lipid omega-6 desaturase (Delta-12 desaturase)
MDDVSGARRVPGQALPAAISEVRQRIRRLTAHCQAYKGAEWKPAILQLVTTSVLFLGAMSVMFATWYQEIYAVCALLVLPAAGLLVRLFIIQHDCGHGSFFPSKRANDLTGSIISVLTFTPYGFWKTAHNMHHASSGNLDRRGIGSIDTLTVAEYQALPRRKRLLYRLFRNPAALLLLTVPFNTLIMQRIPGAQTTSFFEEYPCVPDEVARRSIRALNVALIVVYGIAALLLGWKPLLALYLPVLFVTMWVGGWLFFIQHQFEDAYWKRDRDWSFSEAAVLGSSYYALPRVLHWFTGNIGLHHIHHLCSLIPNYRLQKCLAGSAELQQLNRMTLLESLQCLRWSLWDEAQSKMVNFRDLKAVVAP